MRFREPDNMKMNIVRMMPFAFLVLAIVFTVIHGYRYAVGLDEENTWVLVGGVATIYFSVRSWFQARVVFVMGDEPGIPVEGTQEEGTQEEGTQEEGAQEEGAQEAKTQEW